MKSKRIVYAAFALMLLWGVTACAPNSAPDGSDEVSASDEMEDPSDSASNSSSSSETSGSPEDPTEPEEPTEPETPAEPETPKPKETKYIYVKTDSLNIRAKASASSTSYGQVDKGVSLVCLGVENGFYKTYYKNKTAYISTNSKYTNTYTMPESNDKIEGVLAAGYKLVGTKYVYGAVRYHDGYGNKYKGFTVTKFDCSSLTQYVFYMGSGTLLQVNTRTQIYQGTKVNKAELARGDLMFFTNSSRYYNTGVERVGHVAIYLGDNKILHTASDYCKIEELSSTRWKYFLEARRMLT